MADVFISYKRSEREAVEAIADEVRGHGLTVWFDASLSAGEAFGDEIDREAHDAKAILVCWSPTARESKWVKAEAMIGFEGDKLVAAYVAGPDGFRAPAPFNTTHVADLRLWLADRALARTEWRSVLRRIARLCGRSDLEDLGTPVTRREPPAAPAAPAPLPAPQEGAAPWRLGGWLAAGTAVVLLLVAVASMFQPPRNAEKAQEVAVVGDMAAAADPGATEPAGPYEVALLPYPYNTADYSSGERVFAQCRSCHALRGGVAHGVGPNLSGMFMRKAGKAPGFRYSRAFQDANFDWDAQRLDQWLANPQSFLPGNSMAFAGVRDEEERRDLIAYLMVETR